MLDELVHEVQDGVVRPVQVVEREHDGPALGEQLEEPAPGRERLGPPVLAERTLPTDAGERAEVPEEPGSIGAACRKRVDRTTELGLHPCPVVRLHDACPGLDHLGEAGERAARAVGGRAPGEPGRRRAVLGQASLQLAYQAGLADAGNAEDRHQPCAAVLRDPLERGAKARELGLAADQRCLADSSRPDRGAGPHRLPHGERLRLPLRLDRLVRLVVEDARGRAVRGLADEHPVRRRRGLDARGRVHHVARDHPDARGRRLERHQRRARVDPDPELHVVPSARPLADGERRPDGALGVVLVGDRSAEDRHHGVADELVHDAAVLLEPGAQLAVVGREETAHVLRVQGLRALREPDEVGEEDRDHATLLARGRVGRVFRPGPGGSRWPRHASLAQNSSKASRSLGSASTRVTSPPSIVKRSSWSSSSVRPLRVPRAR